MPTAVDYVLEGLAKYLELDRELGVRFVDFDRGYLKELVSAGAAVKAAASAAAAVAGNSGRTQTGPSVEAAPPPAAVHDFVFLHHAALNGAGIEMMAKIVTAMKKTPETAPIVYTGERPRARIYVVLGSLALRQWFPGRSAAPGQWFRADGGEDVLVTYSPEYILRFGATVTPALKKLKGDMWTSLRGVMQRFG